MARWSEFTCNIRQRMYENHVHWYTAHYTWRTWVLNTKARMPTRTQLTSFYS